MVMVTAHRTSAVVDGVRIAYEDVGAGSPALVLIHGAFGDRSHYAAQIAHFAERRRVIAVDLRGHGESELPPQGFRVRDLAGDVVGVCHAAGVDRAILCGHSIGGAIALEAARLDPALVAGIVLLDGAVLFPQTHLAGPLAAFAAALDTDAWRDALMEFFGTRMFTQYDSPALRERIMGALTTARREVAAPMLQDLFRNDYAPHIAASSCPLLFVHSRIPADLGRLRQLRPDALIGEIVGAGHYAMLEVPDQVNAMLDRFVAIAASEGAAPSRA